MLSKALSSAFAVLRTSKATLYPMPPLASRTVMVSIEPNTRFRRSTDPAETYSVAVDAADFPGFQDDTKYAGLVFLVNGQTFVVGRTEGGRPSPFGGGLAPLYLIGFRLPSDSITARRAVKTALFEASCDILRKAPAVDTYGRPTSGAEAVAHVYPCTVIAPPRVSDREETEAERTIEAGTRRVELPWDADVLPTDRLRVFRLASGARVGDGDLYEVTGVEDGITDAETLVVFVKGEE